MTLRDEYIAVLRDALGPGYESSTIAQMERAFARITLAPKLKARLKAALDGSALLATREAVETALASEEAARKQAEADADDLVDTGIGSI